MEEKRKQRQRENTHRSITKDYTCILGINFAERKPFLVVRPKPPNAITNAYVPGGGTGFIGRSLSRILRNKGYEITVISRMPGLKRITWHDVKRVGIPDNVTAVVNLAGQNVLDVGRRWTEGFKQNVWNSRVQTTCALAKAIAQGRNKPAVFITISGVGIYKPDNNIIYNENTTVSEFDFFSKLCLEWENAAKLPSDVLTRQVTIRSGVVLGTDGGMVKQLYLPFYLGLGGPISPGNQYLPWIHIDDITRLFLFVIESANISGVLNAVAPEEISNKEFSQVSNHIYYG